MIHNGRERIIAPNPHLWRITYTAAPQLSRETVRDVGPDILRVGYHATNDIARPPSSVLAADAPLVQRLSNLGCGIFLHGVESKDFIDNVYLFHRPWNEDNSVGCNTLLLAPFQEELRFSSLIDQQSSKPVSGSTSLAEAEFS